MIYLDASAVLALLLNEPAAQEVETLFREAETHLTSVTYAEVVDQAVRVQGKSLLQLAEAFDPLLTKEVVRISDVTGAMGRRAGDLRSRHYHRKTRPVSLSDCVLVSAASLSGADVATSDQFVIDVAVAEGVTVQALPNSRGMRPTVRPSADGFTPRL